MCLRSKQNSKICQKVDCLDGIRSMRAVFNALRKTTTLFKEKRKTLFDFLLLK